MLFPLPNLRSVPAAVLLLALAGHAVAQSLPLTNANFEIPFGLPPGTEDAAAGYSVPGWVEYEPSGYPWEWDVYAPLSSEGGPESGTNVLKGLAYSPATAYVEQVLTNALQNGTRYTLSGWVADPDGHTPENGAQFLLFAGTNLLTTAIDTPRAAKTWNQASQTYDSGIDNPYTGLPLKVRIMHNPGNSYRVLIDNLSLMAVSVSNVALPAMAFTNVQDYGFMFWSNGPAAYHYGIKTSRYGMAFNWASLTPTTLFPIANPSPESAVLTESWAASFPANTPLVNLSCQVLTNGVTNIVEAASAHAGDVALIECGKYFQRRWQTVQAGGLPLASNQCGLEVAAWPDRLSFVLRLAPSNPVSSATLQMTLALTNLYHSLLTSGAGGALQASNGTGFVFLPSAGSSAISFNPTNATVRVTTAMTNWQTNQQGSVGLVIYPVATNVAWALTNALATEASPLPLAVTPVLPSGGGLAVNYDTDRGWYDVSLPASGTAGDNGILRAQVLHVRV